MPSPYGDESPVRITKDGLDVLLSPTKGQPQDANECLEMVRRLEEYYGSQIAKLQNLLNQSAHENSFLRKDISEVKQYVASVLKQDGPQPG